LLSYGRATGDLNLDPSLPITDGKAAINSFTAGYVRTAKPRAPPPSQRARRKKATPAQVNNQRAQTSCLHVFPVMKKIIPATARASGA
jgi:hypothetical protein